MKVVAFVPVKLNSVRVPGKNIKPFFDGTPLIHLVQRSLLSVPELSEIYCYCSNQVICDYLLEGITFLKRPAWLDTDSARGNDIIKAFAETVNADLYLMAHATSPFVKPKTYSQAIQIMRNGKYDSALSVTAIRHFLWIDGKPNYPLNDKPRSQDISPIYNETNVFLFNREVALQGKNTGDKPYLFEVDKIEAVDIDYPEDFILADLIYQGVFTLPPPPCTKYRNSKWLKCFSGLSPSFSNRRAA